MRWPGSGNIIVDYTIYHVEDGSRQHRNGLAVIVLKETSQAVSDTVLYSDQLILIHLQQQHSKGKCS